MASTPPTPPIQQPGGPQPARRKSAKFSMAALIMGIIALISTSGFLCALQGLFRFANPGLTAVILFALLGLIFGIIALAKKCPKPGLAIIGIVLSSLSILGTPLVMSLSLAISTARIARELNAKHSRRTISMTRLSGISKAIMMYDAEYDQYPTKFSQLISTGNLTEKDIQYPGKDELGVAYCYLALVEDAPAETIMACEKAGFDEEGRNVLLADGSVQRMTNDEFAAALAKPANAKFAKALKRAEGP